MTGFINYIWAHFGWLVMALSCGGVSVLAIRDILTARRINRETRLDMQSLGAPTGLQETEHIPLSILKATRRHASKAGLLVVGLALGWLWRDHQMHNNMVEVVNAVVESQDGLRLVYHYQDDPAEKQHGQVFCAEPKERVPHLQPRQIIASMKLLRDTDCERVYSLDLRRRNGVAILAGGY